MSDAAVSRSVLLPGATTLFIRELVATPRRWRASIRLSAGATLATAGILAFQVPHGEYLVVILFLVGVNDGWGSPRRALWRMGALVVGSLLCITSLAAFSDKPWILFPLQCVLLGAVIFASRTTTIPYAAVLVAVCFLLTVPEYVASPEVTIEAALWSLAMIGLGALGGTLIQLVIWRETPQDLLLSNFTGRFQLVEDVLANALDATPAGRKPPVHGLVAATNIARQLQLLEDAEDESPFLRQRHTEQLRLITDVQLLVRGALEVEETLGEAGEARALPPQLAERARQVLSTARGLREALEQRRLADVSPPSGAPVGQAASDAVTSELGQALAQMERALLAMPDRLGFLAGLPTKGEELSTREAVAARPLLAGFRLDNVEEVRVAVKAALAIAICGLTYETLNWPGISACVFAILLLAQGNVGASLERSILQVCGVLLGAVWAFVVVVVAMPNMTSVASLLVMLFPLYFAVSWLAYGGGVTTAAALQMAMAAILVLLPGFGPTTDLLPARDRVVGILLGNVVFAAINLSLWPVYAGTPARFAQTLRALAELEQRIALGDHDGARLQAFAIHRRLAMALALQDQARFEPHPRGVRTSMLRLTAAMQGVFQELLDAGRLQWSPGLQAQAPAVHTAAAQLAEATSARLGRLADCLEKGVYSPQPPLDDFLNRVRAALGEAASSATPSGDVDSYLALSRRLIAATAQLEDVLRDYTGLLVTSPGGTQLRKVQAS
jgi:multidrug resistance protein MdtO